MRAHLTLLAAILTTVLVQSPAIAQDVGSGNLVYTPTTPCRLLDTRVPSARSGPMLAREERDFLVYDADLATEQGGAEGGCGLPSGVQAVAINLTAVKPASGGYLTAWAYGETRPLASSLNLIPGENLSNAITVAVNTAGADPDLMLYAHVQTELVADVVGYYTPLQGPDCYDESWPTSTAIPAGQRTTAASPMCDAGYMRVEGWCDIFGVEDMRIIEQMPYESGHACDVRNSASATRWVKPTVRCCRVAGN